MGDSLFILFVIVVISHGTVSQVGNTCYMRSTRIQGICKISSDCPEVEEQGKNGIAPTVCGYFQLTIPIVCCEGNSFTDGDFQSPSRPVRPDTSFAYENDNSFSNGNTGFQSRPAVENTNIHFNTPRPSNLIPDDSFSSGNNNYNNNNDNSDSIVYPGDVNSNINNQIQRKSEAKCKEYTKPLNDVVQAIPLLTDTEVVNINIEKCDNNGVPLIVGGEPAAPGEFPFMAALGFMVDGAIDWRCGATLISEYYVITAAHCTYARDAGQPVVVRLGEIDLTKPNGGRNSANYNIANITVHSKYSYPYRYNDIALIKLSRRVRFTKYIRPACLYSSSYLEESQSIATGYGKNEFAASENINKLMKVALNIYDNDRCAQTFGSDKRSLPNGIVSSMLCAGELKGGRDTCQGDSGGPLLVTKKSNQCKFYLIGVTSFGKSCGEANTPAVYTKVSEYLSWIEDIVWG